MVDWSKIVFTKSSSIKHLHGTQSEINLPVGLPPPPASPNAAKAKISR